MNTISDSIKKSIDIELFSDKDFQAGYLQARYSSRLLPEIGSRLEATDPSRKFIEGFNRARLECLILNQVENNERNNNDQS